MKQHFPAFLMLVNNAKKQIRELSLQNLKEKIEQQEPFSLIDVREDSEWSMGHIPGAVHLSKGIIERDIEKQIPSFEQPIVVYCSGGFRSALVANTLQTMGYQQVYSVEKGMQGWIDNGFDIKV